MIRLHSVGFPWTSDRPVEEACTCSTQQLQDTFMLPAGFEPAIPASERSQTLVLDRVNDLKLCRIVLREWARNQVWVFLASAAHKGGLFYPKRRRLAELL